MSRQKLRQAVLRDLAWLFNATRPTRHRLGLAYPEAERSVVNYGLPALSGETASSLDVMELERIIRQVDRRLRAAHPRRPPCRWRPW
ncbi:MAG: GPW/gp25 family protein [Chromatiales bacterium]|nr:GPW/gp25 family protein [Chromatiales bacterium]